MRPRSTIAPLAVAQALAVVAALAQPNLPPPPPPPMGEQVDLPPSTASPPSRPAAPAAPAPATPVPQPPPPAASAPPPPRRLPLSPPPVPPSPPPYRAGPRRHRPDVPFHDAIRRRPIALTFAPLPLVLGRLSVAAEALLAPHHSLVASPNVLLGRIDRGGRYSLVSEGFGFASTASGSLGLELGYHYWWHAQESLRGPFFGPSLLVGDTTQSIVDPSHAQGYWGLAWDVGGQEVFAGGLTLGAGAGLGLVRMAGATALFPRLLMQIGWSW